MKGRVARTCPTKLTYCIVDLNHVKMQEDLRENEINRKRFQGCMKEILRIGTHDIWFFP